jgi:hypothetical protein
MKGSAPLTLTLILVSLLAMSNPMGSATAQDPDSKSDSDEDDLLDGDLLDDDEPTPATEQVTLPPPEVKRELDARIAALANRSEAIGDELFVELKNTANANAEIERRIEEAEANYKSLSAQVAKLSASTKGARAKTPRGYGTPLTIGAGHSPMADLRNRPYDPLQPIGRGADPDGLQQLKWWEKLLLQLAEGVTEILKVLAEKRTNSLKAEADAISLGTDARYRPYVNSEVRKAVGTSGLGSRLKKSGTNDRLNDLLPKGVAKRTPTRAPAPVAKPKIADYTGNKRYDRGPMPDSYLLPERRDALTGEVRPMVALPLGAAPRRR